MTGDNDLLHRIENALRFKALQAANAATHAIGCTSHDAVQTATKHHYERIAYYVAADLVAQFRKPENDMGRLEVESWARSYAAITNRKDG